MKVQEKTALLDKMIFGGIQIMQIENMKKLVDREIIEISNLKIPYVTAAGDEFTKLHIEQDGVIDKFVAGSKMIGGKKIDYCNLQVTIGTEECGNLICYTFDDYVRKLMEIQNHLEAEYDIIADFSDLTVKEVEINRTFKLQDDFEKYHRVLNLIMTNLPGQFKNQNEWKKVVDGSSEFQTYYATSKRTKNSKRYVLFKIYNKTKAIEHIILLTDSYMRVELRLVGSEKVKKALHTNRFFDMSDELFNQYFDTQMFKLIQRPFVKWKSTRDKYLLDLMKSERSRDIRHWQTNVLRILQNEEIAQKRPILLDVEELIPLIDKLNLSANRRCDVRKNFRKQAKKYESVFCNGDHLKLDEIIQKLTVKDSGITGIVTDIDGMQKIA